VNTMTSLARRRQRKSVVTVQTTPAVTDPRELVTILTFSLRDLFGDLESHSCRLEVSVAEDSSHRTLDIICLTDSVPAVRAALTMVTPPGYLSSTVYRFDVMKVNKLT
jgi:RNase P/RNase MRP subunit POP5